MSTIEIPTLAEFAARIRRMDWSACMSDSPEPGRRHSARVVEMEAIVEATVAQGNPNYKRLWELGRTWHGNFTWSCWPAEGPRRHDDDKRAARYEEGWRWVGAYLWVHGLKPSEAVAKSLVRPIGWSSDPKVWDQTGEPVWQAIEAICKKPVDLAEAAKAATITAECREMLAAARR
jgi:hypothetical protein